MEINPSRVRLRKTMDFLRMVSNHYGAEMSHEVWTELSKILGDDELTMGVMTTLLKGDSGTAEFRLVKWHRDVGGLACEGKVPAIKKLREWTRVGLKESKDAVEEAEHGNGTNFKIAQRVDDDGEWISINHDQFEREMRAVGLDIEYIQGNNMYHWNSQKIHKALAQIPGIASVKNSGPGGDVDTDNFMLELTGTDDRLFIRGFTTQDYDRKTMKPYELPNTNDVEIDLVELTDGKCHSGGLNSSDSNTIMAYALVRTFLAQDGADVIDQLKDYF